MTREERIEQAKRLMDESDGTWEDLAAVVAKHARYTAQECEAFLELALRLEVEKLMGGGR